MAVRTAYVGTQVAGDVLTAANFSKLPGGWLGWASATANQTGITTDTDLTGLTVTVTVGSNRLIKVSAMAILSRTVADGVTTLKIKQDSTLINGDQTTHPGTSFYQASPFALISAPSAGSHTYKLSLERTTGTGTVAMSASATQPALILVEDLGPSS